jgi:hypothetical protein
MDAWMYGIKLIQHAFMQPSIHPRIQADFKVPFTDKSPVIADVFLPYLPN